MKYRTRTYVFFGVLCTIAFPQLIFAAGSPIIKNSLLPIAQNSLLSSLFATLSLGEAIENGEHNRTIFLQEDIEKKYVMNPQLKVLKAAELFVGLHRRLTPRFQGELGVSFALTSDAELAGNIWDDGLEEYNNFTYTFKVQHKYLGLKTKILMDTNFLALKPYISGSVGIAYNNSMNFTTHPLISEAISFPDFLPKTVKTFSYSLGIGIQRVIKKCLQLGIGYEFTNWGISQLAAAPEQTTENGLIVSHLYTNGLFLSISWIPEEN